MNGAVAVHGPTGKLTATSLRPLAQHCEEERLMADDTPEEPVEELPDTPEPPAPPDDELKNRIEGMSKSLQKVTQELAQLNRHAAKQGGELDEVQEAKRKQAQAEAQRLRTELEQYAQAGESGEEGIDQKLTKTVLEQARRLDRLEAENQTLRSQVQSIPAPSAQQQWDQWETKYPGADVKAIWKEAFKSADNSQAVKNAASRLAAEKIDQETFDEIKVGVASDLFHDRAAASTRKKALPTASAPPPPPPTGGRTVPMRGGSSPATPMISDPLTDLILRESEKMDKAK